MRCRTIYREKFWCRRRLNSPRDAWLDQILIGVHWAGPNMQTHTCQTTCLNLIQQCCWLPDRCRPVSLQLPNAPGASTAVYLHTSLLIIIITIKAIYKYNWHFSNWKTVKRGRPLNWILFLVFSVFCCRGQSAGSGVNSYRRRPYVDNRLLGLGHVWDDAICDDEEHKVLGAVLHWRRVPTHKNTQKPSL